MLGNISKMAAQILIEADLREEGCPDETLLMEVMQALDSIKEKAGTDKDWEWDFGHSKLGYRHGSYYLRDLTKEEKHWNARMAWIGERWGKAL